MDFTRQQKNSSNGNGSRPESVKERLPLIIRRKTQSKNKPAQGDYVDYVEVKDYESADPLGDFERISIHVIRDVSGQRF